jgi:hypothetical protein
MGLENVNRCQHVKVNGTQCGSPALRRRRHCFFHKGVHDQRARIAGGQFGQARFVVPVLEDANAVQMGLMQVMQLLATGQMDHRTAGLMLYALQTASANLRNTQFEAEDATDVVIDRDTVNKTYMGGPQWVEEDFDDEAEEEEDEDEAAEEVGEEPAAAVVAGQIVTGQTVTGQTVSTQGVSAQVRAEEPVKKVEHVSVEEARRRVQGLVRDWVLETVGASVGRQPG